MHWTLSKHVNDAVKKDAKSRVVDHCISIRVEINEGNEKEVEKEKEGKNRLRDIDIE